jgi:hypothetical protein
MANFTNASKDDTGVWLRLVTGNQITALPEATACGNAQNGTAGRCANQYAAMRRCNTMSPQLRGSPPNTLYFCLRAQDIDSRANQEMSFSPGGARPQPVFIEIAYLLKDLTNGNRLTLSPAGSGLSFFSGDGYGGPLYQGRGATMYYTMHWQKTVGRGASYHAFQGVANVSHD